MGGNSLWVIKNSGRPVIFKLRTIFGRKIMFFYRDLNIFNVKIKRFNVKSKQNFNKITGDCARETDVSIAHYRRLRLPESRVDCARRTDASIRVSFCTKNRAQLAVLLLHITADCDRRTVYNFAQFLQKIIFLKELFIF